MNQIPAVELCDVYKCYGTSTILEPLNVSITPGETIAIAGPSGAGKTTLLRIIAGSLAPDDGRVFLLGNDLSEMRPGKQLSRSIGMIAQQFDLVPNLSALQNVMAGRLGEWSIWKSLVSLISPRDREVGYNALKRVGVLDRAHIRASRLSGGEQQRVAIARVLVQNPAIIVADEPVSSLDPVRSEEVVHLLVDIASEGQKTLIASIHSIDLATRKFGRIIGLRNGSVFFDVRGDEVSPQMLEELYSLKGLRSES